MTGFSWIAPCRWAPLIVLVTMRMYLSETVSIGGLCLVIPIGVHLAQRYSRAGLAVLALAGLPLLVYVPFKSITFTADWGVYLSALIIGGWLLKHPNAPYELPRLRLVPWVYLAFLILPLHMGLGSIKIWGLDEIRWDVDCFALFYLLVWALGVSRAAIRPVLIGLGVVALFGMVLEYASIPPNAAKWIGADRAELPWLGLTELRPLFISYRFDTPADLLTAVGFFFFGRFVTDVYYQKTSSSPWVLQGCWLTLVVVLLAFGGQINAYFLPGKSPALYWMGSFYAILLTGMVAGFYFRFGGIVSVLFVVTAFWSIDGVLRADFDVTRPRFIYRLDHLLYVYGFGLTGIRLRNVLAQTSTQLWSGAWFRYLFLYLLLLVSFIPLDGPYSVLVLAGAFLSGIAVSLVLGGWRQRLIQTPEIALRGGWLSLATLTMMGFLVFSFSQEIWQQIRSLLGQMVDLIQQLVVAKKVLDEDVLVMGVLVEAGISLVGVGLLTSTLKAVLVSTHQLVTDLQALYERWQDKVPMILRFRWEKKEVSSSKPRGFLPLLSRTLTWVNWGLVAALIILPLVLVGYNGWLDYQKRLARERRYSDESPFSEETLRRRQENEKVRSDLVSRLTDATRSVLKDFPDVNVHNREYMTSITSGWYQRPDEPNTRRRVKIGISLPWSFQDISTQDALGQSLQVYLYRQDKGRFNLWVEHNFHQERDRDRVLADEMKQAIVGVALAWTPANK